MKNQKIKSIIVVGFLVLFATFSANAQTGKPLVADIPFDFYVKNQKFEAGKYTIERAAPNSFSASIIIRQKDGKKSKILMLLPLELKNERGEFSAKLIFNRYGSEYFLSEVQNPADDFGAQSPKVRLEKNYAKQHGEPTRETVLLSTVQR